MKKGALICFIGMDGSGKSMLSSYLSNELETRNYNVKHTWWLEGEDSFLRRIIRKVGKFESKGSNGSNAEEKSLVAQRFKSLYTQVVLMDYLRFGMTKASIPKKINRNGILIFDRFFYDAIYALSSDFDFPDSKRTKLMRIYSNLLPNPDLIFIIDVSPEVSYLRRKDEINSLEDAKSLWKYYQDMYSLIGKYTSGKMIRIDNTRDIDTVKSEILTFTLDFLN